MNANPTFLAMLPHHCMTRCYSVAMHLTTGQAPLLAIIASPLARVDTNPTKHEHISRLNADRWLLQAQRLD